MTIFISIASYQDPLLLETLCSAYENAESKDNLRFGVCEQAEVGIDLPSINFKDQIEYELLHPVMAKGPCWARARVQKYFKNEEYYLQIDSHTIFANKKLILRIISILIIIISFIISITETGSQIGITLMIISMVMICWFLKKKIFFLGILLIVFNFYFFQDIKIEYREKISEFSVELRAPITKILNFFDLSTKAYKIIQKIDLFELIEYYNGEKENIKKLDVANFQSSNPELDNKSRVSAARLSMSPVAFNFILNKYNKGQLNLKNGETYKPLLLFFIPRVLWPNKPISSFGIEYGITSGISNIDYPTSINLSWISESFWNFGEYFFIAMFFKGIILSFLSFLIIFRKNCVLFYSWLATIISLVIAENNFSLMISPIFFKFIFLIIIIQIYKLCFVSNEKNKIIS